MKIIKLNSCGDLVQRRPNLREIMKSKNKSTQTVSSIVKNDVKKNTDNSDYIECENSYFGLKDWKTAKILNCIL